MKQTMLWAALSLTLAVSPVACSSSGGQSAAQRQAQHQADLYAIDQIEKTWHKAASRHDVNLMMTLWAPDATFNIGTETLSGQAQIRSFFTHKAGPFKAKNHWVSDTPAYKVRITASGNKGTLYFECDYVDVKTRYVVSVVAADQNVEKINGKWLITSAAASAPTYAP